MIARVPTRTKRHITNQVESMASIAVVVVLRTVMGEIDRDADAGAHAHGGADQDYARGYMKFSDELVREHNSQLNPTGKVLKANKRAATDDAQTSLESRAVVLQVSQETKESIMQKGNVHEAVGSDPPRP